MSEKINDIINKNADVNKLRNEAESRVDRVTDSIDKVNSDNDFVKRIIRNSIHNFNPEAKGKMRAYVPYDFQKLIFSEFEKMSGGFDLSTLNEEQEESLRILIRKHINSFSSDIEKKKLNEYWNEELKNNYIESI